MRQVAWYVNRTHPKTSQQWVVRKSIGPDLPKLIRKTSDTKASLLTSLGMVRMIDPCLSVSSKLMWALLTNVVGGSDETT